MSDVPQVSHVDTPVGSVKIGDAALDAVRIQSAISSLSPFAVGMNPLQRIGAQQAIGLVASLHARVVRLEAIVARLEARDHG